MKLTTEQQAERYRKSIKYITEYSAKRYHDATKVSGELRMQPCMDCGFQPIHPSQMDFDHVRGEKKGAVSRMALYGTARMLEEIAKCDIVCANCHRLRTHERKVARLMQNGVPNG